MAKKCHTDRDAYVPNGTKQPTHRRMQDLEVLYKISNIINTTLDRQKVLKAVLKEVVRITCATSGSIAMLDKGKGLLIIESATNIPSQTWKRLKLALGVGVTGWAAYKGEPVRISDVRRDSHYIALKPDIRSELAVPMFLNGEVIGVINVDSTRRNAFTEDDEKLLIAVADQSAQVIETARLYGKLKRHTSQLETLFGIGKELASPRPLERIMELVVREGRRLLETDICMLLEVPDMNKNEMCIVAQKGLENGNNPPPNCSVPRSILAPVVRRRQTVAIEDLQNRRFLWRDQIPTLGRYHALLAVPVIYQDDLLGVLVVFNQPRRTFNESDISLLQLLANHTAVSISNARRQERIAAMEESLNRTERFSLLGTLAAEIAHEIRNPVTIMNLLLDSISEEVSDRPRVQNDLAIVREKLERIERIVVQTLNMAKNRESSFTQENINKVLGDVLMFMNYKLTRAQIEVRFNSCDTLPLLWIDRGQVQQIIMNLILNAMQSMPSGGRLTIRILEQSDRVLGDCAAISIQDTGCGIAKDTMKQLFDPFFTTRPAGTGLGLFISHKLATANRGDIQVKSKEGKGSTFKLLLPVNEPERVQETS